MISNLRPMGRSDDQPSVTEASSPSPVLAEASQVSQLAEELAVASDEANKVPSRKILSYESAWLCLEAQVATMAALLETV